MTTNRKIVQLSLITIGTFLILSTYFFYPIIKENKLFEENVITDEMVITDDVKTDDNVSNTFENVTYVGENAENPFTVRADRAEIKEDANIVHMEVMLITIFLKDSKWNIECAVGTYNKLNYNIFCFKDVKATDNKVIIFSQNLDLINDETATIYNNVVIIDENKSSLYADKVSYDFENKLYHISMFDQDKNIKIKLIE